MVSFVLISTLSVLWVALCENFKGGEEEKEEKEETTRRDTLMPSYLTVTAPAVSYTFSAAISEDGAEGGGEDGK